ncbi:MAG TPA: hypothetical protein VGL68_05540 [Solirubrobacteraceae bacterium]|jgi:hypothetical protein
MTPRQAAAMLAVGRAALGMAVLAVPERVTAGWLGSEHASQPVVQDLARSLGARDAALGFATLWTLDDPVVGARVQTACAAVDTVDALATILARKALPPAGVFGTVAIAGGAAAVGFYLARATARA